VAFSAWEWRLFAPLYFAGNELWYWKTVLAWAEIQKRSLEKCGRRVEGGSGLADWFDVSCAAAHV
jgi:hypothetical protein